MVSPAPFPPWDWWECHRTAPWASHMVMSPSVLCFSPRSFEVGVISIGSLRNLKCMKMTYLLWIYSKLVMESRLQPKSLEAIFLSVLFPWMHLLYFFLSGSQRKQLARGFILNCVRVPNTADWVHGSSPSPVGKRWSDSPLILAPSMKHLLNSYDSIA